MATFAKIALAFLAILIGVGQCAHYSKPAETRKLDAEREARDEIRYREAREEKFQKEMLAKGLYCRDHPEDRSCY